MEVEQKIIRTLAWLMRNEGVPAEAIERAVESARFMRLGEQTALTDDGSGTATMRRAFLMEQVSLLLRRT